MSKPCGYTKRSKWSLSSDHTSRNGNGNDGVKDPKDFADFIIFCEIWHEGINNHHSYEEEYFFPWVEEYTGEKVIMEINVEQHKAFEAGADQFRNYFVSVTPETYDGKKLKTIIDSFGQALTLHLTAEIESLLAPDKFGGDKLLETWRKFEKKVLGNVEDKSRFFPAPLGAMDNTFEGGIHNWPTFPFFVPYLAKYVFVCWELAI